MRRLRLIPPLGLIACSGAALLSFMLATREAGAPAVRIATTEVMPSKGAVTDDPHQIEHPRVASLDPVFQERPLFSEGRRAPQPRSLEPPIETLPPEPEAIASDADPEAAPEPAAPEPPAIELIGLVASGAGATILIRSLEDGREEWLQTGDAIGPWTLAEISQHSARFESNGLEFALSLFPETLP